MKNKVLLGVFLLILCIPLSIKSGESQETSQLKPYLPCYSCKVIRIIDGDTLEIWRPQDQKWANKCLKIIRLEEIDAPEMSQEGGASSKAHLSMLVRPGDDMVTCGDSLDKYGRILGHIFVKREYPIDNEIYYDVNRQMVLDGYAWSYLHKDGAMNQLEEEAREYHRGIWQSSSPVAPWDYRKQVKHDYQQSHKKRFSGFDSIY